MSIPSGLGSQRVTSRPLSDQPMPAIFGSLINLTGIGTAYAAAGFAPFISPANQTAPVVALFFTNTGSESIFISFDGVEDNIIIPASSNNIPYNLLNNKRGISFKGVWARSSAAGGSIYISYLM